MVDVIAIIFFLAVVLVWTFWCNQEVFQMKVTNPKNPLWTGLYEEKMKEPEDVKIRIWK